MKWLQHTASYLIKRRLKQVQYWVANPIVTQQKILRSLLNKAQSTNFGKKYDFSDISTIKTFQNRFPIQDYNSLQPYIQQILKGNQNVLWPTPIQWFAKSSGTTSDRSKLIPVSREAMQTCHYRAAAEVLALYLHNKPDNQLFTGKGLIMGGSHSIAKVNSKARFGDLSAVLMQNMPWLGWLFRTPKLSIAIMDNWEEKLERMAQAVIPQNITHIAGVPTWTLLLIQRIFELTGKNHLLEVWPNLELYLHGGVSFTPYVEQFAQLIPSKKMHYVQNYNASEGYFAIQDRLQADDMLLLTDHGIFYEFIPVEHLHNDNPKVLTLENVELYQNYALVITTNAGLWRYKIGDTIQFTSLAPYRIQVTGRTKHFINAFGEEVIIDNADKAIAQACADTGAKVREYMAAPVYFSTANNGAHEWLIEFEQPPQDLQQFTHQLDAHLQQLNSDYEAKRFNDLAMRLPIVQVVPKNTFYKWLKSKGKLGGQHKIPRLANHRRFLEEVKEMEFVSF